MSDERWAIGRIYGYLSIHTEVVEVAPRRFRFHNTVRDHDRSGRVLSEESSLSAVEWEVPA